MKFLKTKREGIFQAHNDDKTVCYGLYGQLSALIDSGVLIEVNVDETYRDKWVFIENGKEEGETLIYDSKDELKHDLIAKYA